MSLRHFFNELELTIYEQLHQKNINTKELKILIVIDQAGRDFNVQPTNKKKSICFKIIRYLLEKKSNF